MGVPSVNDSSDERWAEFLSSAAARSETDERATREVLAALKRERDGVADGSAWATYLSKAAQLNERDAGAVQPALAAVRRERQRLEHWRLNVTRFVTAAAAAAAVVVAVTVLRPAASADPSDAYSAYQEASRGW